MRSWIWDHCSKIDNDKLKCKLCSEILIAKGGNTSAANNHLRGVHNVKPKSESGSTQPPITGFVTRENVPLTPARKEKLDNLVLGLVTKDMLPIRIVEMTGFSELMKY